MLGVQYTILACILTFLLNILMYHIYTIYTILLIQYKQQIDYFLNIAFDV
jgi:hypothetical protein